MKEVRHIAILTPGFATCETDSTNIPSLQLFISNLIRLYPEIKISIIAFHYPKKKSSYTWNGIEVFSAGGSRFRAGKKLIKLNKKNRIDCIHAFWLTDTALIGCLAHLFMKIPVVITSMGQDVKKSNRYLKPILLFKPKIICLSEFHKNYNPLLSEENPEIIPFGTDHKYFTEKPSRSLDIIGAGSINTIKNYPDFIMIINDLKEKYPELKVRIIGQGDQSEEIRRKIIEERLSDTIEITGELPYAETISEMKKSRILLHTSLFESQGLVITEALAAGAYVVSYPTGIASELKSEKVRTGKDKNELSGHLKDLLNDHHLNHDPEIFFTIEQTCQKYHNLYHKLV